MIPMHENLKGRVAVITGGSGVLCSEMARELARQGVKVAILNRTAEKGQQIVHQIIENGGTAIAITTDVLDRASLEHARDEIVKRYGRIDVLINGAGGNHPDSITDQEVYSDQETT